MAHLDDAWHATRNGRRVRTDRYGRGRRWVVRYRDPSGRHRGRSFARKAEAEAWLADLTVRMNTGEWADPTKGRTPFGVFAEEWLDRRRAVLSPKTLAGYDSLLRSQVLPAWGDTPVRAITTSAVEDWVASLSAAGLSGSRVRQAHGVLSMVLRRAVSASALRSNPAAGVPLPSASSARRRYLTHAQVASLADALPPADRTLTYLLAYCGLRWGEAIALRWTDLLPADGRRPQRLRVERAFTEVNGHLLLKGTKTDRVREVPLPNFLAVLLEPGEGLMFPGRAGRPLRVQTFRRRGFDAAATAAGVPGLTPHELRHTSASLAVSAGANVLAVARMLGHSRPSETLNRYADLFLDDIDAVAVALDAMRNARATAAG